MLLVRDCMTPGPHVVLAKDSLQRAVELMIQHHVRHLPVVNDRDDLVGLLTDRDLRRLTPSPLTPYGENAREVLGNTTIEQVMVRGPMTVTATLPLREAVKVMIDRKFGCLPVVQSAQPPSKLVGILTPIDVMRAFLQSGAAK